MVVGVSLSSKCCRVKILVFYFPPLQLARDYFEEHSQSKKLNSSLPSEKPRTPTGVENSSACACLCACVCSYSEGRLSGAQSKMASELERGSFY